MAKKIYAIAAQKGGVGKSTTATTLTAGLTLRGYKTLLVDLDGQANSSFLMGVKLDGLTALDFLLQDEGASPAEIIQHTQSGDIIAGDKALYNADSYFTETGKEYKLKEALDRVAADYDYIIIDTPPALGLLTTNALTAADAVIIPAHANILSLQSIADLMETSIKPVKKYCNRALTVEGVLLNRYSTRGGFNKEIAELTEQLATNYNTKVFTSTIREAIAVRKAQANQLTIFEYEPKGKVAEDYNCFIEELIG